MLVAIPFLFWYWCVVEERFSDSRFRQVAMAATLTVAASLTASLPLLGEPVVETYPIQYTQSYDLLALSVKTDTVLLPPYITDKVGASVEQLRQLYFPGGNNLMYFNTAGNLSTTDSALLADLAARWQKAILAHPLDYLEHRLDNFWALLRIGSWTPGWVAVPVTEANQYGFAFAPNILSRFLQATETRFSWMYLPWVYLLGMVLAAAILLLLKQQRAVLVAIGGSAVAFVLPHLFIAPASDYRYLYYVYLCTGVLVVLAFAELVARRRYGGIRRTPQHPRV
jgi:hypothetical protein